MGASIVEQVVKRKIEITLKQVDLLLRFIAQDQPSGGNPLELRVSILEKSKKGHEAAEAHVGQQLIFSGKFSEVNRRRQ